MTHAAPVTAPVTAQATRPVLVAKVAIVIARANDGKILGAMERHLEPIDVEGDSVENLRLKATTYVSDAVKAIGDPGPGAVGVALDAAVLAGVKLDAAARGYVPNRDA